jgi:pantetheine-phosphate adenylyltransferase
LIALKVNKGYLNVKFMDYKNGIYPGTFDPITNGHLDIIKRASRLFKILVVGVAKDSEKNSFFTPSLRKKMIEDTLKKEKIKNVKVKIFSGLLVNFAKMEDCSVIVRGLRAVSDFEYEFQMACVNSKLDSALETIFLPSSNEMHFISSRFIKSIASLQGDVSQFVPESVVAALTKR